MEVPARCACQRVMDLRMISSSSSLVARLPKVGRILMLPPCGGAGVPARGCRGQAPDFQAPPVIWAVRQPGGLPVLRQAGGLPYYLGSFFCHEWTHSFDQEFVAFRVKMEFVLDEQ